MRDARSRIQTDKLSKNGSKVVCCFPEEGQVLLSSATGPARARRAPGGSEAFTGGWFRSRPLEEQAEIEVQRVVVTRIAAQAVVVGA